MASTKELYEIEKNMFSGWLYTVFYTDKDGNEKTAEQVMEHYMQSWLETVALTTNSKIGQEKPKKDIGNFVEGKYLADEIAILMNGEFTTMKFENIESNPQFKKLDEKLQMVVGMISKTIYEFNDGKYSQKALMGGWGLWREYDVKGNVITMPDQKEIITMSLLKDGRIQHKTADGTGQEIFITYKMEEK